MNEHEKLSAVKIDGIVCVPHPSEVFGSCDGCVLRGWETPSCMRIEYPVPCYVGGRHCGIFKELHPPKRNAP